MKRTLKYSKALEIERDLFFKKKNKTLTKNIFDKGESISLSHGYHDNNLTSAFEVQSNEFLNSPISFSHEARDDRFFVESFEAPTTRSTFNEGNSNSIINSMPSKSQILPNAYEMSDSGNEDERANEEQEEEQEEANSEGQVSRLVMAGDPSDGGFNSLVLRSDDGQEESEDETRSALAMGDANSFENDIKAILSGQMLYDEEQKRLKPKDESYGNNDNDSPQSSSMSDNHNNGLRNQEVTNPHAIFDSLAQSFGTAKSYDLGTFDLEKSFSKIEEEIEAREAAQIRKQPTPQENQAPSMVAVDAVTQMPTQDAANAANNLPAANSSSLVESATQLSLDPLDISEGLTMIADEQVYQMGNGSQMNHTGRNQSQSLNATPFERLLSYLNITEAQFTPFESDYFNRLKELLIFHNIITASDTVDRNSFGNMVADFQRRIMNQTQPDGIPGEDTLFELQSTWAPTRGITMVSTGIVNHSFNGSHINFQLRSDALVHYNTMLNQVVNEGGIITSAGSIRSLNAPVTPGRSSKSMHYTGLAIDLHTGSGMQNTANDAYLVERVGTSNWQVWNKVSPPLGSSRTINAEIYNSSTHTHAPTSVSAQVIDFTQIANSHGFKGISNRSCFPADYLCAEWWHFQCERVLVPFISQFGSELLTIYPAATLQNNAGIWSNRKKIFKKDWF